MEYLYASLKNIHEDEYDTTNTKRFIIEIDFTAGN